MKKLVLALTTVSVFALTACGGSKEKVEVNEPAAPAAEVAAPPVVAPAEATPATESQAAPAEESAQQK